MQTHLIHSRLLLASGSETRRAMLAAAGVMFEVIPARIDERALEADMHDAPAGEVAQALAQAKAYAVSVLHPGRVVLGGDSLVTVAGRRFDKPVSRQDAADHLRFFSGRVMELTSAVALARSTEILWSHISQARLFVRRLTEPFIKSYLADEWPGIKACVGAFRIEGAGVNLFEHIEGDHYTVLGMPLLAVLGALRGFGILPE